jgi:hypothetical protein
MHGEGVLDALYIRYERLCGHLNSKIVSLAWAVHDLNACCHAAYIKVANGSSEGLVDVKGRHV